MESKKTYKPYKKATTKAEKKPQCGKTGVSGLTIQGLILVHG